MTVLGGIFQAARKVSRSYRLRLVFDDGSEVVEVVRFPWPGWFVTTALLFIPAGTRLRLSDGTLATVTAGRCRCDYGLDQCENAPLPGRDRCVACLAVCVPLSQGRSPFEPGG